MRKNISMFHGKLENQYIHVSCLIFRQISICHKYEHLGVFLHCLKMKDIKAWEINVEFTLKLTTSSGKSSELSCSHIWIELGGWGWHKFISWDTMMKDYLIDNVIIIEATAKITEVTGFTKKALRSFDESNEEFSDVIIAVEDEKFYVLKQVCFYFPFPIFHCNLIFFSSSPLTLHTSRNFSWENARKKLKNQNIHFRISTPSIFRIF